MHTGNPIRCMKQTVHCHPTNWCKLIGTAFPRIPKQCLKRKVSPKTPPSSLIRFFGFHQEKSLGSRSRSSPQCLQQGEQCIMARRRRHRSRPVKAFTGGLGHQDDHQISLAAAKIDRPPSPPSTRCHRAEPCTLVAAMDRNGGSTHSVPASAEAPHYCHEIDNR